MKFGLIVLVRYPIPQMIMTILALSGGFWALPQHTQSIFRAKPFKYSYETPGLVEQLTQEFLRTGLIGVLIDGKLVVFGIYEDRIKETVRTVGSNTDVEVVHYATDISKNILFYVRDVFIW